MQIVSQAYKDSMKSPIRERGYIRLSFGLINQEAQKNATINKNATSVSETNYYSNEDTIFSVKPNNVPSYATLEEDFTKVDGSMYFPPRDTESAEYLDTGLVSKHVLTSSTSFVFAINLNTPATDVKGLTINFGENYPTFFALIINDSYTIEFTNDKPVFVTERVFEDVSTIKLIVTNMKKLNCRFRVHSIQFGYGLNYHNDSVISSSLDSYISPIGADVPQIDFSVQLKNYDKYFNVDNPASAINFLETGQEMVIHYGYQLPGSNDIEWVLGNTLQCSDWEADDNTATIRCQDVFRNMDSEYYKGNYSDEPKTYYSLVEEVLSEVGITNYSIDASLLELYTRNPLPRVKHKEALQIIANACGCVLSQTREGAVEIKSLSNTTDVQDFTMSRNDMMSSPKAIKQEQIKEIIVPIYSYQKGTQEESLFNGELTVASGDIITFFVNEPSHDYRVMLNDAASGASIVESGSYYVNVLFNNSGTHKLEIFGYHYKITEQHMRRVLNNRGKTIKWDNPLISNASMAELLSRWLADYYAYGIEYEYDTRGNPELDVNDIIYQDNDFTDGMMVNVYRQSLKFNQSFSGHVTARRVGG
jgi:hypothetical protein